MAKEFVATVSVRSWLTVLTLPSVPASFCFGTGHFNRAAGETNIIGLSGLAHSRRKLI